MKDIVVYLAAGLLAVSAASAQVVEFDADTLKSGSVSSGKDCISVGMSMIVTAMKGGRIVTYSTSVGGFGSGIYIGAVEGQLNTTNNKTAPKSGVYRLTFSRPVNAIQLSVDAISNLFKPAEMLSEFRTDNGPAQVTFQPVGNTAVFDPVKQTITSNARNGDGVISHSSAGKFSFFEFRHEQHPQNIGFTIKNVKVEPSPFFCP